MKCEGIREDLGAYLDGELDPARRSELDGHLASCEACTAQLERLRRLSRLVADVPRATAPAGLAARIVSAAPLSAARAEPDVPAAPVSAARAEPDVPAAREPRPRVLRLSRWTGGLAALAAVLLVGVVSIVALRERDAWDMADRVAETVEEESAAAPAAGEARTGAALDREKLDERAVTERRVLARKGRGPEKRRDAMFKKEAASRPDESAPASGPPAARVHRKGAPPLIEKGIAVRSPAAPKAARPGRKGKADTAPPASRERLVGKRIGFKATRGKTGPGGRAVAQQAVPARRGEQVQVELQAPGTEADESDRSRGRLVELLRKKEKDRTAEALLAKAGKAKAPAREEDRAGGEPVIRLQLHTGSPGKELARIIAAARLVGGESASQRIERKAVQRRAVRSSARDLRVGDEATREQPSVVRVRIPRDRTGEFLASLEGLALPEADRAPADGPARTRTRPGGTPASAAEGQRGAAVSRARRAEPSQGRATVQAVQEAGKGTRQLIHWVVIEIVIRTPSERPAGVPAARGRR